MNQSNNLAGNLISAGKGVLDNEWFWSLIMLAMAGLLIFIFLEDLAKIGKWVVAGLLGLFFLYGSGVMINKKEPQIVEVFRDNINTVVKPSRKDFFLRRWWRKTVLRQDDPDIIAYGHDKK
jgi:hypothetical protein